MLAKWTGVIVAIVIVASGLAILAVVQTPHSPLHGLAVGFNNVNLNQGCNNAGGNGATLPFTMCVRMTGQDANGYYTSDYIPNGTSSPIGFLLYFYMNNSNCLGTSAGVQFGAGASPVYFQIWVTSSANGQDSGHVEPIGSATGPQSEFISDNSSQETGIWCYSSSQYSTNSEPGSSGFFPTTFSLPGTYSDYSILHVAAMTQVSICTGTYLYISPATTGTQCSQGGYTGGCATGGGSSGAPVLCQGSYAATGEAILRSGYSQLYPPTTAVYNGQPFSVGYCTGYSPNGYILDFEWPAVRPNGGTIIAQKSLGYNLCQGSAQFTAPANASSTPAQGVNVQQWNEFQLVLFTSGVPAVSWPKLLIDISPQSAPGAPSVTWADNQHSPPNIGDTITLSFSATWTNTSGQVSSFNVAGYYEAGEATPPTSNQYWIGGSSAGAQVTATRVGTSNTSSGTYSFSVGYQASMEIFVTAFTSNGQGQFTTLVITVVPANCGNTNCQPANTPSWLATWGPIILAVAIVAASAVVALIPGMPPFVRYVVIIVVIAETVVFVFLYGFLSTQFASGAI